MAANEQDIYEEHVLDHYEDPYHRGPLETATHVHAGKNPLCGDVIQIHLRLSPEGRVDEAWFEGQGCVISQASASMLTEKVEGKTLDEVKQFSADEMLELFGPRLTPNRQKCCLLSWKVLQGAVHSPVDVGAAAGDESGDDGPRSGGPNFGGPSLGEES